jgi:hypothetical protein
MTKKDYETVGNIIGATVMPDQSRVVLVDRLTGAFAKANPKFLTDRFSHAAGVHRCGIEGCEFVTTDEAARKSHLIDTHL